MILVWEGVDLQQQAARMVSLPLTDLQTEHERYLRDYVLPQIHGFDPSQPPPPPVEKIASIQA